MSGPGPAFPVARWVAAAFLVAWAPPYAVYWGWKNFLQLCDIAVVLTVAGLWCGSARLLSAQAVGVLVVDALWTVDTAGRLATGRHWIGGTEYMFDDRFPLWVRLISLFHVAWPIVLVWALRRTGYDPAGWKLQAAIAAAVMAVSRVVADGRNVNFVLEAPFVNRAIGPPPVHVALCWAVLAAAVYWPTHRILATLLRHRPDAGRPVTP